MPKHLRIVVGLMILGIVNRIVFAGVNPSPYMLSHRWTISLLGIVITIGVIKDIASRSSIAWHIAKMLNILTLLAMAALLVLLLFFGNISTWMWTWYFVGIVAEIYSLWVLFSLETQQYFKAKRKADNLLQATCEFVSEEER